MLELSSELPKRYGVQGHGIYITSSSEIINGERVIVKWEIVSLQDAFIKETADLLRGNARQREDDACEGLGVKDLGDGD